MASNEIHLYEMLTTNLLTCFSRAKRSHDTTSWGIVSHRTRSGSTRDENNVNNNFFIKYHRHINFHDLYKKSIYIKNIKWLKMKNILIIEIVIQLRESLLFDVIEKTWTFIFFLTNPFRICVTISLSITTSNYITLYFNNKILSFVTFTRRFQTITFTFSSILYDIFITRFIFWN